MKPRPATPLVTRALVREVVEVVEEVEVGCLTMWLVLWERDPMLS